METIYINAPEVLEQDKKNLLQSKLSWEGLSVNFLYDSDFKSAKILRDYVEAACDILGLENKWKSRLILITDELNNNAIEYGSWVWEKNNMRFSILQGSDWIHIQTEIEDTWKGTFAKTAEEMENLRKERTVKWFKNHDSIRWRGLFMIITNLVDNLYFKDSENGWLIVGIQKTL